MRSGCCLLMLLLAASLYCQTERGNIIGQVKDPRGVAVPSAEVVASHLLTNVQAKTVSTAAGDYNLPVPPGSYRVIITAPKFKRYEREGVSLATGSIVRLEANLNLGAVSESVRVSTDIAQIQTKNAKVSTAVQKRLVDELQLVPGDTLRNPFDLVILAWEGRGSGQALVLGIGQAAEWNATLDRLPVTTNRSADTVEMAYNASSVEAITEFTADTNGSKAEYGQTGGNVMTFSSKSGTNDVRGSAYDFCAMTLWIRADSLRPRARFTRPMISAPRSEAHLCSKAVLRLVPDICLPQLRGTFAIGSGTTDISSAPRLRRCTRAASLNG